MDTPARHTYTGDGSTRGFRVPTRIIGDDYVRIEIDGTYVSDRSKWDIVNNTILFVTAPAIGAVVDIQIATSQEALGLLGNVTNVDIVAADIDNVNNVGSNIVDVTTVADDIASVNTVAANIDDVNTVANDIDEINTLASIEAQLLSLYSDRNKVTSLFNDKATLDSLFADKETLDGLFSSKTAIDSLYSIKAKLDSLYADKAKLDSLYADKTKLDSLYADKTKLDTLYANISKIVTVYDNITNVVLVGNAITNVNSVATTIVPNIDEILKADSNALLAKNYANEDEDVEVEAGLFSAKHYAIKALELVTNGVIDDEVPSDLNTFSSNKIIALVEGQIDDSIAKTDKLYSSSKVQTLHDAQAQAIANLSGANASFYNNSTTIIPESQSSYVNLTWTTGAQSSNTDIFELGTNEIVFKRDGIYNFLNTLTYYRIGSGAACVVNYEIYDADTNAVLASFNQNIDLVAGTKETVPMNASLTISGIVTTKRVKVRARVTTDVAGTVELFTFNSLLALATVTEVVTGDAIDDYLGGLITEVLI